MVARPQRLFRQRDPFAAIVGLDHGKGPFPGGDGDRRAGFGLAGDHGVAVPVDAHDIQPRRRRRLFGLGFGFGRRRLRFPGRRRRPGGRNRSLRRRRRALLKQVRIGAPPQGVEDQRQADDGYGNNAGHEHRRFVTIAA